MGFAGGSGNSVAGASDAVLNNPANNQVLTYDSTTEKWKNANPAVTSVAGKTGTVSLTSTDVGLDQVDNTSDINKPISSATQTALNTKLDSSVATGTYAPKASPTFTGTVTVPTPTNPTDATTKSYVDTQIGSGVADATTSVKGKIQLSGDLGGTAAAPSIVNNAITTAKILDAAVTEAKLSSAVQTKLNAAGSGDPIVGGDLSGTASSASIVTDAITTTKLLNGAVTSAKIASSTIVDANISASAGIAQSKITNLTSDLSSKINASIFTTKGDLITATGSATPVRLGVGSNGQVLTADSTQSSGIKWATPATGSGSAVTPTAVKTTAYTAAAGDLVPVDATSAAVTITLPTAPIDKAEVVIKKIDSSTNVVTVTTGSGDVFNKTAGSTSQTLTLPNQTTSLQYNASTGIWYVVSNDLSLSQLDSRYVTKLLLDATGTTDIGPIIQAGYDAGLSVMELTPGGTYLWDTSVFLDSTSQDKKFEIRGNGAIIKLGSGLLPSDWDNNSTTDTDSALISAGEATPIFAIYPNTRRGTAGSIGWGSGGAGTGTAGVVSVQDNTRAPGPNSAQLRPLIVRNVTIDGQGHNRGFCFSSRSPITLEHVVFRGGRVCATWHDYCDSNRFDFCYSRIGPNSFSQYQTFLEQLHSGDGLVIHGPKADSGLTFAKINKCRGGIITSPVTVPLIITNSTSMLIIGGHQEGQQGNNYTEFTFTSAQVTIQDTTIYQAHINTATNSLPASIVINDTQTETASDITLINVTVNQVFDNTTSDLVSAPFIELTAFTAATRVRATNLIANFTAYASGLQGKYMQTVMPTVIKGPSGATTLATELASDAGRTLLASGNWELTWLNGSTSSPQLKSAYGGTISRKQASAPNIFQIVNGTTAAPTGGTLVSGSTYEYTVAAIDAYGNYSDYATVKTTTAGSTGSAKLLIYVPNPPTTIIIWRRLQASGHSVSTDPTHYIIVGAKSSRFYVIDTGNFLQGQAWQTTSVPTPVAVNSTVDAFIIGSTRAETINNKGLANGYAGLDGSGKVPASQLPAFPAITGFPVTAYGYYGWTIAPDLCTASSPITAGSYFQVRTIIGVSGTINNVHYSVVSAGTSLTAGRVQVYDTTGTLLGQTASQATAMTSTGTKDAAILTPFTVTAGQEVLVVIYCIGTTGPNLRASGTLTNVNIGTSASSGNMPFRSGSTTGVTADFTSITPNAASSSASLIHLVTLGP